MRWEKTGTTDYRFPGKNLKKELVFVRNFKCQSSNAKCQDPPIDSLKFELWILAFGIAFRFPSISIP